MIAFLKSFAVAYKVVGSVVEEGEMAPDFNPYSKQVPATKT